MTKILSRTAIAVALTFGFSGVAQAQGAEFFANPFIGFIFADGDGDVCLALVSPPTDDLNDFIRVNPNGETFVHIAEHPATITVFTASGVFTGTGSMTANAHGLFGGKNQQLDLHATGQVTSGAVTHQAVCNAKVNANGVVIRAEVDLH